MLDFVERTRARRTLLFHHEPLHTDDQLDELERLARARWAERRTSGELTMAVEGAALAL